MKLLLIIFSFSLIHSIHAQSFEVIQLQNLLCGFKHLSVHLYNPANFDTVFSKGYSNFSPSIDSKYIREDFEFSISDKSISGSAYISYSEAYDRFELLQIDNTSKSSIVLNGIWDDTTHRTLTFFPVENYPQWGLPGTVQLKWKYIFQEGNTFTKEIWLASDNKETLSSSYNYSNHSIQFDTAQWEQHSIPIHDGNIFFQSTGKGQPILLINGGPGWSSNHIKPFAEMLNKLNYRVIIYDQRGTGNSKLNSLDSNTVSLKQMVIDIEVIRKHLNLKSWIVAGHSFGAMLAMNYCVLHPDNISKLLLLAPGGMNLNFFETYQSSINARLSKQNIDNISYWTSKTESNSSITSMNIIYNTLPAFLYYDSLVNSMMNYIDTTTWNSQTASLIWNDLARINFDITPGLKKFSKPVLIVQGNQDALGNQHAMEIKNVFQNSQLQFINNAAHIIWADQPLQCLEIVSSFLK